MHGRRRLFVAVGIASVGAGAWMGRLYAERVLLPVLPLHGECLDSIGGWADLARGDLPAEACPAPRGSCEFALLLADDESVALPARIIARRHAIGADCPPQALQPADLTLPPDLRRARASARSQLSGEPWASEAIAIHGLWGDSVLVRAGLGDPDALDLAADLVLLDSGAVNGAAGAIGPPFGVGEAPTRWPGPQPPSEGVLHAALLDAAGRPERGANQPPTLELAPGTPAPADALDLLTGSGDATHALLAEAAAVQGFVGTDKARLEAALFSPASAGSAPGDVHGAFVAGGGSPGATALAAALVWGDVHAYWVEGDAAVAITTQWSPTANLQNPWGAWQLDGCSAARRVDTAAGQPASPLALALAERVGAWLRAGDVSRAREAEALLQTGQGARPWAPRLFDGLGASAGGPPWVAPVPPAPRRGSRRAASPVPTAVLAAAPDRRAVADALFQHASPDEVAVAAWAAWRAHDDELARMLLVEPPPGVWPRYAWRTVAQALGEPSEPAVRPEGCAPALWVGPF